MQVRLYEEPSLNHPIMIAGWAAIGGVGVIAAVACSPKSGPRDLRESCRIKLQEEGLENQEVFGDTDSAHSG